jgi:uncharacterized membrane protein
VGIGMKIKISILLLSIFFVIAGSNHFINPQFYLPLIPNYLPFPEVLNYLSGVLEMVLGVGILLKSTRRIAAIAIIVLLVLFLPSHIHFIQLGSCIEEGLCVPSWMAWGRLMVIHPLLIYWAYIVSKK